MRSGLARAGVASDVAVHLTGMGPAEAEAAADALLAAGSAPRRVVVAGLCGALSPALHVGDVLFYSTLRDADGEPASTDAALTARLLDRVPGAQSGIRALGSALVVIDAAEKAVLARRYDVDAVDMESLTLVGTLSAAGSAVAVLRVVSDGVEDDLPDLNAAMEAEGAAAARAVLTAVFQRPGASLRMARNGIRALGALTRAMHLAAWTR